MLGSFYFEAKKNGGGGGGRLLTFLEAVANGDVLVAVSPCSYGCGYRASRTARRCSCHIKSCRDMNFRLMIFN